MHWRVSYLSASTQALEILADKDNEFRSQLTPPSLTYLEARIIDKFLVYVSSINEEQK